MTEIVYCNVFEIITAEKIRKIPVKSLQQQGKNLFANAKQMQQTVVNILHFYWLEYGQKSKDRFGCYKNISGKFPEMQAFIGKAYSKECCKENISVDEVFFSINNNC